MKAEEAIEISMSCLNRNRTPILEKIYEQIKIAATNGQVMVIWDVPSNPPISNKLRDEIRDELILNGYEVFIHDRVFQIHTLEISWMEYKGKGTVCSIKATK